MKGLYLILDELGEMTGKKLMEAKEKARAAGGLSCGDIDYLDKLTHAMKNIVTVKAMIEDTKEEEVIVRDSMFASRVTELIEEAPNDHVRSELQRILTTV